MEINYNWEKKANKQHAKSTNITMSSFNLGCDISIWDVAIMANGAKVNTNVSLLLLADKTKIRIPIKNEAMIFLYEESNTKGLLDKVENIEKTKNNATVRYIAKAAFW